MREKELSLNTAIANRRVLSAKYLGHESRGLYFADGTSLVIHQTQQSGGLEVHLATSNKFLHNISADNKEI